MREIMHFGLQKNKPDNEKHGAFLWRRPFLEFFSLKAQFF